MRRSSHRPGPYSKHHGYPVRTHKRDVYWRLAQVLGWSQPRWWEEVCRSPSVELGILERLIQQAERGSKAARLMLVSSFERVSHPKT